MHSAVVVIDDSSMVRFALGEALATFGYAVVGGPTVEAVSDQILDLDADTRITAVIADYWLAGYRNGALTGVMAMRQLESLHAESWRSVIMTSDHDPAIAERARSVGAMLLRKPFGCAELLNAIGPATA